MTRILERAYVRPPDERYFTARLKASLRNVSAERAAWRPSPDRHNVWEEVLHLAYWKSRYCRVFTQAPPRRFEVPGSNWFARPIDPTDDAWRQDLALLELWQRRLVQALRVFPEERLDERAGAAGTYAELIHGIAEHDAYHNGQIRLLLRLQENARARTLDGREEAALKEKA